MEISNVLSTSVNFVKTQVEKLPSLVTRVWSAVQPFFQQGLNFLQTPLGAGLTAITAALFCFKLANEHKDCFDKLPFQLGALASAVCSGIFLGKVVTL